MLAAALLELHPAPETVLEKLNSLGLPGLKIRREAAERCGIRGSLFCVEIHGEEEYSEDLHSHEGEHAHNHEEHTHSHEEQVHSHEHTHADGSVHSHAHSHEGEHAHSHEEHIHSHGEGQAHVHSHHSLEEICGIIRKLPLSDKVKEDACQVYSLLAEAEGQVHGRPAGEVHFHEVGTMDAIADIVSVCLLIRELQVDRIQASPIRTGKGQVRCAHGILPVPAPATARLLQGLPVFAGDIDGEMCTPTGAALLRYFVDEFCVMPLMEPEGIGYGMGKKEFPHMNGICATIGEEKDFSELAEKVGEPETSLAADPAAEEKANDSLSGGRGAVSAGSASVSPGQADRRDPDDTEEILELSCNLDDMTGEQIGFAMEQLFAAGARDVFTQAIGMKKNRPGVLLTVICAAEDREKLVRAMFRHTTTLGIRETLCRRYVLKRSIEEKETDFGPLRYKVSEGYGIRRCKPEYEDLARMAREQGCSIEELRRRI